MLEIAMPRQSRQAVSAPVFSKCSKCSKCAVPVDGAVSIAQLLMYAAQLFMHMSCLQHLAGQQDHVNAAMDNS